MCSDFSLNSSLVYTLLKGIFSTIVISNSLRNVCSLNYGLRNISFRGNKTLVGKFVFRNWYSRGAGALLLKNTFDDKQVPFPKRNIDPELGT